MFEDKERVQIARLAACYNYLKKKKKKRDWGLEFIFSFKNFQMVWITLIQYIFAEFF